MDHLLPKNLGVVFDNKLTFDSHISHILQNSYLYFDLSRASDTFDHKLLLEKLDFIDIRGVTNEWAATHLRGISQIVAIDDAKSSPGLITEGVPQGLVLAFLFFILSMSDLEYICPTPKK